jgi:hypothetical protein
VATAGYCLLAVVVVGETLADTGPLRAPAWADAMAAAGLLGFAAAGVLVLTALVRHRPVRPRPASRRRVESATSPRGRS